MAISFIMERKMNKGYMPFTVNINLLRFYGKIPY